MSYAISRTLGCLCLSLLVIACASRGEAEAEGQPAAEPDGLSFDAGASRAPGLQVPVPGGRLFAEDRGTGPVIVFIHGGQLDRRVFDDSFEELAADFRVMRYDVRGYGQSSDPEAPYASHDDLVVLLDALDVERAHLVGFSLGGRIALDAALVAPDRVASLVLVGPGISGWDWSMEDIETFGAMRERAIAGDLEGATEAWLQHPWMQPAMEDPARAEAIRAIALDNARCWTHTAPDLPLDPPALRRLDEIRCPTLVLVGDRDLRSIHEIAGTIGSGVEGAEVVEIEDCGHVVPMEQPGALTARIRSFVPRD